MAIERSHARRGYADFREMLQKEKPDLVAICPRWLDQRLEMITAAAKTGAHMLVEKPLARDLTEADAIVRIANDHRVKIEVCFVMRTLPIIHNVRQMVVNGA